MSYEFNGSENSVFDEVALWMRIVAFGAAVDGVLMAIPALQTFDSMQIAMTGARFAVAVFLFLGGSAFKRIVDTKGDDIEHTMGALRSLRSYFFIQAATLLITIGVVLYALVVVSSLSR